MTEPLLPKIERECDVSGPQTHAKVDVKIELGGILPPVGSAIEVTEGRNGKLEGTVTLTEKGTDFKFNINDPRIPDSDRSQARSLLKACHAQADSLAEKHAVSAAKVGRMVLEPPKP